MLLLLLFAIPSSAGATFTAVRSKNFTLVGNATPKQIRNVAESLELFRWGFLQFFKVPEKLSSVETTVVAFRTDSDFTPFKPTYNGKPTNISGYFQAGRDMNFIALAMDRETPRVIYHELVHTLMADNFSGLPAWFQEGFAECFASFEVDANSSKIRIGRAIGEHIELLNQKPFMPLKKLFEVTSASADYNETKKQGLFYAQSWALVHYLMLGDGGKHRSELNRLLAGIREGRRTDQVFEEVFHTDLFSFQKSLEAYVQQRLIWEFLEMAPAQRSDLAVVTEPLSEAEWEFYLGDLLLHSDRIAAAEARLKHSIELDGRLAGPQAAMGRLRMRQKNDAEALSYLEKAQELDPNSYLAHYYHAAMLRSRSTQLSEPEWLTMRLELMKTIELAPQFIEATEMLANVNLTSNVDIPQTISLLARALLILQNNENLIALHAYALSRTVIQGTANPSPSPRPSSPTAPESNQSLGPILDLDRVVAVETLQGTPSHFGHR